MTVGYVLGALWRHKFAVAAVLLLSGLLVAANLMFATRSYTADAVVSFSSSSAAANQTGIDGVGATISTVAATRDVLNDVSFRLHGARSALMLANQVSAAWVQGTILVQISATDTDPRMAADIANLVADNLQSHLPRTLAITLSTTESASVPQSPSSPDTKLVLGAGGLLALILAALVALWRDRTTSRVGTHSEVEVATRLPVLARMTDDPAPSALPALYPGGAGEVGFRRLRVALAAAGRDRDMSRLTVVGTSSTSQHVDVWVASNLAIALVQLPRRALLIDGRRFPEWGPPLPTANGGQGLREALRGTDLESLIVPGPLENLDLLPAGTQDPPTTESGLEAGFERLMDKAVTNYDVVIVLAPPLELSDDALVLSTGSLPLLVVSDGCVTSAALAQATDDLRSIGAEPLGSILVSTPSRTQRRALKDERKRQRRIEARRSETSRATSEPTEQPRRSNEPVAGARRRAMTSTEAPPPAASASRDKRPKGGKRRAR